MSWPTFTVDVTQNSNQIKIYGPVPASEIPAGFEVIIGNVSNLEVSYGTAIMYDGSNNPYSHLYLVRPYTGTTATNLEMVVKPTGSQFNDVVGIFQNGSNLLNNTMEGYRQFVEGTTPVTFQPLDENAAPISIKPLQQMNQEAQATIDSQTSDFNALMSSTTERIDEALASAQNYANDTISTLNTETSAAITAMGNSVETAIGTFMNGVGSSYYSDTQSGYVTKPEEFIETNTPNTIIDPNTAPIMVDGRLVEVTDQNIVLPSAPFASDTSRTETSLVTTGAVDKGDFVVVDQELVTNGTFDTDTSGWGGSATLSTQAGKLSAEITAQYQNFTQSLDSIVSGAKYVLSFDLISNNVNIYIGLGSAASYPRIQPPKNLTTGNYRFVFTAASNLLQFISDSSIGLIEIDNISVKPYHDTYQAIEDVPTATSLANTTYFQPIEDGISRQDIAVHRVNKSTLAYDKYAFKGTKKFSAEEMSLKTPVMDYYFGGADSNGLWSDATYWYVPIAAFTRFNAGAYHPWFNEFGTAVYTNSLNDNNTSALWYNGHGSSFPIVSVRDNFLTSKVNQAAIFKGALPGTAAKARPDGVLYDKVYLNQTLDLRLKAYAESKQDLLNEVSQQIENGSYGNGIEGAVSGYAVMGIPSVKDRTYGAVSLGAFLKSMLIPAYSYKSKMFVIGNSGQNYKVNSINADGRIWLSTEYGFTPFEDFIIGASYIFYITKESNNLFRNTMPHTDLIGNPANYPQSLKDRLSAGKSVVGMNPLLVGQDGTDYSSMASPFTMTFSKKLTKFLSTIYFPNDQTTYEANIVVDETNKVTNTNPISGLQYFMIFNYTAKTNSAIEPQSGTTLSVLPKVFSSNSYSIHQGGNAVYSAIGKVPVSNAADGYEQKALENTAFTWDVLVGTKNKDTMIGSYPVGTLFYIPDSSISERSGSDKPVDGHVYKLINYEGQEVSTLATSAFGYSVRFEDLGAALLKATHSQILLNGAVSPASKRFYALSELDNGLACLDMYSQEMISNAGVYDGDSAQFTQLSDGTLLDDNANTIITSVRSIPLNSFVGSK
ncbi:hypothetical protein EBI00_02515 [Marinomonas hwangdonensis]|uniref:Uncharacterized protein n=1 Tax=Marinomonas hwangdonensis TaxID=1053647 RepID=A0A3M8QA95_9GAMM|nr:hypothetical protein [Marinomonas hwangdonensis]RNF52993.1 hypothetical protein EBI00_02515 [Marinomonas hwangdonensis]